MSLVVVALVALAVVLVRNPEPEALATLAATGAPHAVGTPDDTSALAPGNGLPPAAQTVTPSASARQTPAPSETIAEVAPAPEPQATSGCPTGVVTIAAPGWPTITVDPYYAATLSGLGRDDRLSPTDKTKNRIEFTGGVVHNGTTRPIVISDVPDIDLTGVSWATANGWRSGYGPIAAGQSLAWGATGLSTFAIASVSGYTLDVTDVEVSWDDDSTVPAGCEKPAVEILG